MTTPNGTNATVLAYVIRTPGAGLSDVADQVCGGNKNAASNSLQYLKRKGVIRCEGPYHFPIWFPTPLAFVPPKPKPEKVAKVRVRKRKVRLARAPQTEKPPFTFKRIVVMPPAPPPPKREVPRVVHGVPTEPIPLNVRWRSWFERHRDAERLKG